VHVVQVDERIAPAGAPDRNLTQLRESLLEHAPLPAMQVYAGARSRASRTRPGRPHGVARSE
jgi:6-phosphogluconolactonase/glucosamine-6-phosphate isomerase/deaminase